MKKGMTSIEPFDNNVAGIVGALGSIVLNPYVFFGLVVMMISLGSHLVVLSKVDISFAYPFLGLSFVLVTAYGHLVLHESINVWRIAGVILIVSGVSLVAKS